MSGPRETPQYMWWCHDCSGGLGVWGLDSDTPPPRCPECHSTDLDPVKFVPEIKARIPRPGPSLPCPARVLVCGGREYQNRRAVYTALDKLKETGPLLVIHGGARGADALAGDWAKSRCVPCLSFPADWNKGSMAGPIRNGAMLREWEPNVVLAFPGQRGTEDMIERALKAGVQTHRVSAEGEPGKAVTA